MSTTEIRWIKVLIAMMSIALLSSAGLWFVVDKPRRAIDEINGLRIEVIETRTEVIELRSEVVQLKHTVERLENVNTEQ